MSDNLNKYNNIFRSVFCLDKDTKLEDMQLKVSDQWDSVGHINLISAIEEDFGIDMEPEDMFAFTSYCKGIEILSQTYNIAF